jgi:putative acetyltransferase
MTRIRVGTPADLDRILTVVAEAFAHHAEAELVRMLHDSMNFVADLSLVAELDRDIVGHVMLTYTQIVGAQAHRVLTLSPLSVVPGSQRQGIGSALVAEALRRADERGEPLVCLEGSPAYYGRLGFEDARPRGIRFDLPDWAPREAGQIYKLRAYNPAIVGKVVYPPAFAVAERLRAEAEPE